MKMTDKTKSLGSGFLLREFSACTNGMGKFHPTADKLNILVKNIICVRKKIFYRVGILA